jgi:hypothetical protein
VDFHFYEPKGEIDCGASMLASHGNTYALYFYVLIEENKLMVQKLFYPEH